MIGKRELARKVAKNTLLTQKECGDVIDEILSVIEEELLKGNDVSLVGFGKFFLYHHKPRPVRNPKTNESMLLSPYKSVKFKGSNKLKQRIKNNTIMMVDQDG